MDPRRFDTLTRFLAGSASRRGIAHALAGLTLAGALSPLLGPFDADAKKKRAAIIARGASGAGRHRRPSAPPRITASTRTGYAAGVASMTPASAIPPWRPAHRSVASRRTSTTARCAPQGRPASISASVGSSRRGAPRPARTRCRGAATCVSTRTSPGARACSAALRLQGRNESR
jgi:hypothetical protein